MGLLIIYDAWFKWLWEHGFRVCGGTLRTISFQEKTSETQVAFYFESWNGWNIGVMRTIMWLGFFSTFYPLPGVEKGFNWTLWLYCFTSWLLNNWFPMTVWFSNQFWNQNDMWVAYVKWGMGGGKISIIGCTFWKDVKYKNFLDTVLWTLWTGRFVCGKSKNKQ